MIMHTIAVTLVVVARTIEGVTPIVFAIATWILGIIQDIFGGTLGGPSTRTNDDEMYYADEVISNIIDITCGAIRISQFNSYHDFAAACQSTISRNGKRCVVGQHRNGVPRCREEGRLTVPRGYMGRGRVPF